MELTHTEYSLLFDALDALQSREASDAMLGMVMGAVLAPTKEARDKMMAEDKAKFDAMAKNNALKERIVLVKAKLIQMRDAATAEREVAGAQST